MRVTLFYFIFFCLRVTLEAGEALTNHKEISLLFLCISWTQTVFYKYYAIYFLKFLIIKNKLWRINTHTPIFFFFFFFFAENKTKQLCYMPTLWKRLLLLLSRFSLFDSVGSHKRQPTRLFRPWDFPAKSTRVSCHCLLRFDANCI